MKKAFLIIVFAILIIPSVTFASWWNPLGWKIFRKTETKTQVLENRIRELEEKLANVASSTVATTTKEVHLPQKPKEKTSAPTPQQVAPAVNGPITSISVKPVIDYEALYSDVESKYYALRQKIDGDITAQQKIEKDGGIVSPTYINFLSKLRTTVNLDMRELNKFRNIVPKPSDKIIFYDTKYQQMLTQYGEERANSIIVINRASKLSVMTDAKDYIDQNKGKLAVEAIHIEAARRLDAFDRVFGSKYSEQFRVTKTRVETIEFADSFLLDLRLNKWLVD